MKEFNRALALSGVCLAASLGALGIGEYANDQYTDNIRACYENLNGQEVTACKEDVGPDPDGLYGLVVLSLGAAGIFMGTKAYKAHEAYPFIARERRSCFPGCFGGRRRE